MTQVITKQPIHYHFDFSRYHQHLVDVTLTFTSTKDSQLLWLPSWIPGSYLMREFSRNITAVFYATDVTKSDSGNFVRANKISKNEWLLEETSQGQQITVTYEVYCYDLSVRTAYVDQFRLFGNFSSLALAVETQETAGVSCLLSVPESFYATKEQNKVRLACGLKHQYQLLDGINNQKQHTYLMQSVSYDELIDYPFEIAEQDEFKFSVLSNFKTDENANIQTQINQPQIEINHRFFISGKHHADLHRLNQDVQAICQTYVNWLQDTPFNDYTFLTFASGNDYGGLEHINSTSLVTPRNDLPSQREPDEPSNDYQRFLGLCSHEYFHAWWVKTVRPDVMLAVNLREEAYTPLLWVFEGFTSYIDDFMLQASGVVNKINYLRLLTEQINRYQQTLGRKLQSVAESSFDAWIKLYRADENTGNAGISYYNKGALVALCLDLTMMKHSDNQYRLFDVIKTFYEKAKQSQHPLNRVAMTNDNLTEVISQFIDENVWQAFYEQYVIGTKELPVLELLEELGVGVAKHPDNYLPWGMSITESPTGLVVNKVLREGLAAQAGISAKDVIIAIDGIKANKKQLVKACELACDVSCHIFRRDELIELILTQSTPQTKLGINTYLDKVILKPNHLPNNKYDDWLNVF